MIKRIRTKFYLARVNRLRKIGRKRYEELNAGHGWYGPDGYLTVAERTKYRAAQEYLMKNKFTFGTDVTGMDFDKRGPEATKALDEAGLGDNYVEVLPLHYQDNVKVWVSE